MAVATAPAALGADLTIQGVNRAEFWAYRDSWQSHAEDKLDLSVGYGDLSGELGLFLFEPTKPWNGLRQPMRLLDYTVAYSPEPLEVLYGKFFQTFGKGLCLRAYSDDDFRHYKSLHGLRGTARLPFSTEVVALAARLRDVFFQENTYKVMNPTDTTDQVLGADLSSRLTQWLGLGGRYVRINRDRDPEPQAFTELFGGNLGTTVGPVDLYGEVCRRLGTKATYPGGREKGLGYYLSGTAAFSGFSVLGEYMDYDKIGFPSGVYHYNDPPTPIKSGVAMNRGENERGFGVSVTSTPWGTLYFEADYGRLYKRDDSLTGVVEWEGKSRYSLGTDWTFEAKFNHMVQQNVELHVLARNTDKPTAHVNYLVGEHTLGLEAEYTRVHEERDDTPGRPADSMDYNEAAVTLSYGYGSALLFTVGWQGVDKMLERRYAGQQSWPMLEAVWNITEQNILRVRIGAERGGYTCSGGVCRFESPFTGAKVQLISRF